MSSPTLHGISGQLITWAQVDEWLAELQRTWANETMVGLHRELVVFPFLSMRRPVWWRRYLRAAGKWFLSLSMERP